MQKHTHLLLVKNVSKLLADVDYAIGHSAELLRSGVQSLVERKRIELEAQTRTIRALDPKNVLRRGYSITRQDGVVVTAASTVKPGATITIELQDGTINAISQANE
jgi:exodeoxyribonuclease VII large subunit